MAGTIVYVDSEPELPEGLGDALGRLGFRLQHTTQVDEALALARAGAARLVLVEVLLEEGRGWHLIRRIRELERPRSDVPIVILTRGERTSKLYGRAVELGANDFLSRPVMRAEVLGAILECVEAGEAGPPVDPMLAEPTGAAPGGASGALADSPLAELMLHLREDGATGVPFLQDLEELVVQLRNGSPIGVASSRGNETFADFLMRTKRISDHEHEALLERAHATGESEPEAAVSARVMSRGDVQAALADRAAESFGMSAHLDPDQGDYRAHLGYALHLQNPDNELVRREALEHIAKGIELAPEQWKPLLYLARVFIAAGEDADAHKVLASAVRRHPDCVPLKEELRQLLRRQREPEQPGLLARLRRWWRR